MKPFDIVSKQNLENLENLERLKTFLNDKKGLFTETWTEKVTEKICCLISCKESVFFIADKKISPTDKFPELRQEQDKSLSFKLLDRSFLRKIKDSKKGLQITDNQLIKSLGFSNEGQVLLAYPVTFKEKMIGVLAFLFEKEIPENTLEILQEIAELIAPYLYVLLLEDQLKEQSKEVRQSIWNEIKEEKYQKLQRAFHQTQEIAQIGSWSMDIATGKVEWSDQLYKIFGYNPEKYRPSFENLAKNTHPDDRKRIQKMLAIAIKKPQRFEYYQRIIRQDGETRIMYGKGYVLIDENKKAIKIIGIAQDVTKRKNLEAKIGKQEQILKESLTSQIELRVQEVKEKTEELRSKKEKLEIAYRDILASMTYARRIQVALLPPKALLRQHIAENVTFYRPRDIVSGDFYWMGIENDKIFLAVVDCTGHGIPGALMSMIGNNLLNNIVHENRLEQPHLILNELNHRVSVALHQEDNRNRDGMDVALCVIDTKNKKLSFAGAKRPLVYIQNGQLYKIKGENISIGGLQKKQVIFQEHTISFEKKTMFYLFSDGFPDQFGGEQNKKYSSKRFGEFLSQIAQESCQKQENLLDKELSEWIGQSNKQIDDIMVLGFRL